MGIEDLPLTSNHWGNYRVETADGQVTALHPFEHDPDPSPIGEGIIGVLDDPLRITSPMVRRSWLEDGPGARADRRGTDEFVAVSWDRVVELVSAELDRVRTQFGNESIFAGSYGWASAGRFHHAQSQLKRFLNCIGGFTGSVNTYSFAAGEVIVPYVLGADLRLFTYGGTTWDEIAEHAELVVGFGGVRLNNGQISQGGTGRHSQRSGVEGAIAAGVSFVNISPIRADVDESANAEWVALRPSTDTALLLGLAHTLLDEGLVDDAFLKSHTVGYARFADYLSGAVDGVTKDASWAGEICELSPDVIRALALKMASSRTLISVSWSMTRQQHGEHVYWAAIALASMLGEVGLPGRGIAFGLSSMNTVGHSRVPINSVAVPQGHNPVETFIPVARISDLLLHPGESFSYAGATHTYPDTKIVWWAGGNPFHHHQDLNRLVDAWEKPDTIIVNDWCWNPLARRADIVLPCTTSLERFDVSITLADDTATLMSNVVPPPEDARNDHDIFSALAAEMGVHEQFTDGRSEREWVRWIYDETRRVSALDGVSLPEWDVFVKAGWARATQETSTPGLLTTFRSDPVGSPLHTPSGRIELFSERIEEAQLTDFAGYPQWNEPTEWLGAPPDCAPLHLITNQPTSKLHSQLDHGSVSRAAKIDGREPLTIHPDDAAARDIANGDVVRVFNDRGACLAAAVIDDRVRGGVIQMPTGAWYDPDDTGTCKHGNPNAVTADIPTSMLAQGCSAHTCMVEVERFGEAPPPITAFEPPVIRTD